MVDGLPKGSAIKSCFFASRSKKNKDLPGGAENDN